MKIGTILAMAAPALALSAPAARAACFDSGSATFCMQDGRSSVYTRHGGVSQGRGTDMSTGRTWSETEVQGRHGTRVYREIDGRPVPRYGYADRDRRFDFGGSESWQFGR